MGKFQLNFITLFNSLPIIVSCMSLINNLAHPQWQNLIPGAIYLTLLYFLHQGYTIARNMLAALNALGLIATVILVIVYVLNNPTFDLFTLASILFFTVLIIIQALVIRWLARSAALIDLLEIKNLRRAEEHAKQLTAAEAEERSRNQE